jgi:hypothetical protein
MSDFETNQGSGSGVGFLTPGALSSIQWIQPDAPTRGQPANGRRQRADNTTALIVVGLTFACTVLALFDLFQLAAGF